MRRILIAIALLAAACSESQPVGKARMDEGMKLEAGDFHLLQPFSAEALKGKVWVASLIFTSCQTSCPPMCQEMASLDEEFANEPDFRIVTATVDPENDTAEKLNGFAKGYGAHRERWIFLTGTKDDIRRFAVQVLRLPWNPEEPVIHSIDFVLVDRTGRIRDYFRQTKADEMKRMREVIRAVLAEKAS